MKKLIPIQSYTDIITNSSSELFIIKDGKETVDQIYELLQDLLKDDKYRHETYVETIHDYIWPKEPTLDELIKDGWESIEQWRDDIYSIWSYKGLNYIYSEIWRDFGCSHEEAKRILYPIVKESYRFKEEVKDTDIIVQVDDTTYENNKEILTEFFEKFKGKKI